MTSRQRDELIDQLRAGTIPLLAATAGESRLGYRGFILRFDRAELKLLGTPATGNREVRVRGGIDLDISKVAESWLLETTPAGVVPDAAVEESEKQIVTGARLHNVDLIGLRSDVVLAACTIYATSSTNFDFWNAVTSERINNNCYNYTANWKTNTFAQPGRASGQTFTSLTLDNIEAAAIRDGYTKACNGHSIASNLWIWPGTDYHWYRKTADVNGQSRWCHKPGQTPATNRDNSGNIITAPVTADRGNYNTGGRLVWGLGGSIPVR
ncbi:hypothetical protein [Allorhizocola rhizosphaerae]|uniref:hypothetical protein n=1 Tax=Allorhizocola rhizosphaerae TaxID=1872709 RepID=UPI0013C356CA|nr:hypothetical protein [Allorhizocola rhizosphaerae]